MAGVGGAQIPPEQTGLASSFDLQEADECVVGAALLVWLLPCTDVLTCGII